MTLEEAGISAGYSEKSAAQAAWQAMESVKRKMPEILDRAGLTDYALVEKHLKPLLSAEETKFAQKDGIFTDERNVAALGIRATALDMAFNLKGSYAPKETHNLLAGVLQVNVQELKSAEETLKLLQQVNDP